MEEFFHSGEHYVGQKQYELANHLGNVQVTVSDLPYRKGDNISPALKSVYDYYPFGSLMPGRTLIDTARKCIDITRTELFWQEWTVTKMEAQAIALSFMNLSVTGDNAELHEEERETRIVLKERDELTIVLHDTVRGGELSLMGEVNSIGDEGVVVRVQAKDSTGATQLIQQAHLLRIAERIDLPLKEGYSDYVVTVSGVIDWTLFDWRYVGGSFVERQTILTVCDDSGDRYRYGFNGQEKVNEISGLGNHNTAEYWEYDTRLGRRWNIDPVDQISVSNYAVNGNNPIGLNDPDGDDPFRRALKQARKMGLENDDFTIQNDPENPNNAILQWATGYRDSEGRLVVKITCKFVEERNYEKAVRVIDEGAPKVFLGYVRYNPLVIGVMNLMSATTGRNMDVKSMEEIKTSGDGVSGEKLSSGRRFAKGVMGFTQLYGIRLGGVEGFLMDFSLEAGMDILNIQEDNKETLRTGTALLDFYQKVKKGDNKAYLNLFNEMIEKSAREWDKELDNSNKNRNEE